MTTNAREDILGALRGKVRGDAAHFGAWPTSRRYDDLAAQFAEALAAAHGETMREDSLEAALDRLGTLLGELGVRRAVVNDEPPLDALDLPARWPEVDWHIVGRTAGDLRAACAAADVGLSGADAALAETGSIVVGSGPGRSRLATLLPPVHVALVSEARLTTDLFTWTAARQGALPACQTVISGPSKTADIEQTLTVGMHGPKRLIVILYRG